jgi:hypothetical protein
MLKEYNSLEGFFQSFSEKDSWEGTNFKVGYIKMEVFEKYLNENFV